LLLPHPHPLSSPHPHPLSPLVTALFDLTIVGNPSVQLGQKARRKEAMCPSDRSGSHIAADLGSCVAAAGLCSYLAHEASMHMKSTSPSPLHFSESTFFERMYCGTGTRSEHRCCPGIPRGIC
jgi:hypothetical protein